MKEQLGRASCHVEGTLSEMKPLEPRHAHPTQRADQCRQVPPVKFLVFGADQ